jgi:hypothetical protein
MQPRLATRRAGCHLVVGNLYHQLTIGSEYPVRRSSCLHYGNRAEPLTARRPATLFANTDGSVFAREPLCYSVRAVPFGTFICQPVSEPATRRRGVTPNNRTPAPGVCRNKCCRACAPFDQDGHHPAPAPELRHHPIGVDFELSSHSSTTCTPHISSLNSPQPEEVTSM